MIVSNSIRTVLFVAGALLTVLLPGCTDEIPPTFQFQEGFLLVDGRMVDEPGRSVVTVSRNVVAFGNFRFTPVLNAVVESESGTGEIVTWQTTDDTGRYRPPGDWKAEAGGTYFLRVVFPTGEVVTSVPETLPRRVPFSNARVTFDQEAYFSNALDRFVPAFELLVDVSDPGGERNYYQYQTTTFQTIDICASCSGSLYRNGGCTVSAPGVERYDYPCDAVDCWARAASPSTALLSDEFSNGSLTEGFLASSTAYSRPGLLLLVLDQYNITRAAFDFSTLTRDLATGGGGLNAPLPAALVGNLTDQSDLQTPVLGFVGVAAVSTERVMIRRDTFDGESLPNNREIVFDPAMDAPFAPCTGPNLSAIEPLGWME